MNKKEIRKKYLDIRECLSNDERKIADCAINETIINAQPFNESTVIVAYISDGTEPNLTVSMNACKGKELLLPRFNEQTQTYELVAVPKVDESVLNVGKYGILEPKEEFKAVDISMYETMTWLIPGVAFSKTGKRLGRGKGIYDRFLAATKGFKIGVFYESQECDNIPMEEHDQLLDYIITDKRVIKI